MLIKQVEASDTISKKGAQLPDASGAGEDSGYCSLRGKVAMNPAIQQVPVIKCHF